MNKQLKIYFIFEKYFDLAERMVDWKDFYDLDTTFYAYEAIESDRDYYGAFRDTLGYLFRRSEYEREGI